MAETHQPGARSHHAGHKGVAWNLVIGTLLFIVCLAVLSDVQGDATQAIELTPQDPVDWRLPADAHLQLTFVANQGGTYVLEVEQGGLDLIVSVQAPNGDTRSFNSPLLRDETELVVIEANDGGRYLIEIYSEEYTGTEAQLTARLIPANDLTEEELQGIRLISSASYSNFAGTMEAWDQALEAYEQAGNMARNSGVGRLAARSQFSAATLEYWQKGRWRRAADLAGEAAEGYSDIGLPRLAASANQLKAASLIEETTEIEKSESGGIAPEASALFDQAIVLFRETRESLLKLGAEYAAGLSANYLGMTYYYMGDWERAEPWFLEATNDYRAMEEWSGELQSLGNLGVIDFERGKLLNAIETFKRILELLPTEKSRRYRADTLDNLAASQFAVGRLEAALRSFSRALDEHEEIDDQKGRGRSLAGIGVSYFAIGETDLALQHLETALEAQRNANDGRGQVSVLNFMGNIRRQNDEIEQAIQSHSEALHLATAPIDQARVRVYLSQDLIDAGRIDEALETVAAARQVAEEIRNQKLLADVSRVSGNAWLQSGNYEDALTDYMTAAAHYEELTLRAEQAQAIFGTAQVLRMQDKPEESLAQANSVIELVESLRSELIAPQMRGFFLSTKQGYYDFLVDLNMELHRDSATRQDEHLRQALTISERSRARALVDLITESSAGGHDSRVDYETGRLYQQMAEARYRLDNVIESQAGNETGPGSSIAEVQQELATIENELNLTLIKQRESNPTLSRLTDPQILSAHQIQDLLSPGTSLLHYDLGAERSYVWQVTHDSIQAWSLPPRNEIEESARALYGLLQAPAHAGPHREALAAGIQQISSQLLDPMGQLTASRLVVVADGALQYLPYSLLLAPDSDSPLIASHEIIYLPSASVLAAQRTNTRPVKRSSKTIAIFADPVLEAADERLSEVGEMSNHISGVRIPVGGGLAPSVSPLTRLPATGYEAQAIAGLLPADQTLLAMGFDASRQAVLESPLSDYRLVHFATHGLVDSRYPALSSLVFSRFDAEGKPQDGFLRLPDIYKLQLNAELVALSACSTALGRDIAGEGLTGLTQGLMYAGSRSVLASLWQVPDRATAELMTAFYVNLLELNQKPAEALRNAQLGLSSQPRWRSPYFWSAFVLQGDWR